jgi:FkbM family methyltransferase
MGMLDDRTAAAANAGRAAPLEQAERARTAGDHRTALALYDAALAADPHRAEALAGRGACLRALGHAHEALVALLEALSRDPRQQAARIELALALRENGRRDEALTLYGLLLKASDAPAEAWHGLARLCMAESRQATAEICLRRAIALAPGSIASRLDLAELLSRQNDLTAAADLYHDVLAIEPGAIAAHAGLGQALIGLGRLDEAEDQLERALVMDADNVIAHLARARLNLLAGNLPAAWDDLDSRWAQNGGKRPEPPGIAWDGNADLGGHTILLWAEPGLGETIHLLRYVPLVADRGAKVVLGLPALLAPLAAGLRGVSRVALSGAAVPADVTIDYNAPIAELPRLFGAALSRLPPAPYLTVPAGHRPPIQAPSTALLKVGLVWAAPRAGWSVPLGDFMPLLAQPGIAVFSLQTGERARDQAEMLHPALITDLSPSIADYADLAGRIAEMDVVITVDGPAAHLAGALGVPTWVLAARAPDWRWMLGRDDSPWYASARLFRQSRPDDWTAPIAAACRALRQMVAESRARRDEQARAHAGPKAAQRAFLTTHLRTGDLVVDVGASDGTHALDAVTHPADDIRVLAIEARPGEAAILADTIAISGAEEVVEVVAAALAATGGPAVVAARPRGGRTVFPLPEWVRGMAQATTLDTLLAERPHLAGRRLVLRLGAKGDEDKVLAGLSAQPALVVYEHRAASPVTERLRAAGYRLFRFPGSVAAGPAVEFSADDQPCPVLALAPGEQPAAVYGDMGEPTSPAAMAHAAAEARRLAGQGTSALVGGKLNEAGALYARALVIDPDNAEALANLGSLLRRIGRSHAAGTCWMRALANGSGAAVRANLANVLRELGDLFTAEEELTRALDAEPDNPAFLFGLGLLERDRGHSREAVALFERAEHLRPGTVPPGQLATALLKSGNLARGMAEMAHRPQPPLAPVDAPMWDGGRLDARTILVRDEGDAIDTLMLARFIPQVARHGGLVVVECVPEAARLLANLPGVEQVVARGQALPPVDVTVNLLDVPRLIGTTSRSTPPRDVPYLHLPDGITPRGPQRGHQLRVGIAWSGRATDRSVPLDILLRLAADPRIALVSLQRGPRAADLTSAVTGPFIEDTGAACADLADSAAAIAGLDLLIAADTAEAHLAGAMGLPVWVLLPTTCDWRWVDGREDSVWYPTMRVFRQSLDGNWDRAMARITDAASAMAAGKAARL